MTLLKQKKRSITRGVIQATFLLAAFLIGLRHILPGEISRGGWFDAFCPFGGIETLWVYLQTGKTLKTTNLLNFSILLAVSGSAFVAGRGFCGWMCPLGTLQDMLTGWARRLCGEKKKPIGKKSKAKFPLTVPPNVDRWLKYLKYILLAVILAFSAIATYPPLHTLCPARTVFGFQGFSLLSGFALISFFLCSLLIKRFYCKYLCPLGAVLSIFNKVSPIHLRTDQDRCNKCGRCENECPMDIPAIPENLRSAECLRCLKCLETCSRPDALDLFFG